MTQAQDETAATAGAQEALPPAALRALAEAAARKKATATEALLPREINGRGALEPVRYGDWEVKGLASDF